MTGESSAVEQVWHHINHVDGDVFPYYDDYKDRDANIKGVFLEDGSLVYTINGGVVMFSETAKIGVDILTRFRSFCVDDDVSPLSESDAKDIIKELGGKDV